MKVHPEEQAIFEVCLVVPKRKTEEECVTYDCLEVLENAFQKVGFIVERIDGVTDEFMKLAAPLETLGKAAARLQMKKRTHIGMDLLFELDQVKAFVRQPDGSLFSWCERFRCYHHLIYGIVNENQSAVTLKCEEEEFQWNVGESLIRTLESKKIVKQIFPLHDEIRRKKLLGNWALNWWEFTGQPLDEVYSYFGTKVALYFAFLGMYTRWLLFPAALGLILQLVEFGSLRLLVLPIFFVSIIVWAVMFSQFWRRKNSALVARWQINYAFGGDSSFRFSGVECGSLQIPVELIKNQEMDKTKEKEAFQRFEWFGCLRRFRNDAIVILSIICLQLPFELAYAHCYEVIQSDVIKFGLTVLYLFSIQYFTRLGAKISMKLINCENYENNEKRADSLVYKIFGLYFMQSYIGVFYHALLHRNFATLRQVLIQRLLISEVLENLLENSVPYLKYSYRKYKIRSNKRREKGSSQGRIQFTSRAEKEYLKPSYSASIGVELEDGLFDDYLELALQFGMIMMFACAFPLAFAFAALNNITEIRTDALKLLAMHKRPFPRAATTIGAWLNIFQFLIVMSICTNCALLVWLYDQEGKWKIEPGLAAILVMEHVLLLVKFGFSRLVPEEPAWVKANRVQKASQVQDICSKQLLRTISGGEKTLNYVKKTV
ncbi:anoctamin-like protein At1g73020 isoform X1 [Cucurbita moschata]|uniref:Anoctamin-like protein At1g73020 isoform X1 n=2 Tax=Cucurbita moschata TaxID=3662 RepID=A0A6J1HGZ5_CUCMO|nr:anoctamin-like protein At1g73020 isoform X1 [Cucurbita moschata]XP_022964134.1 anoctamin-like protein At1g73020 isoform X1 [Cucurbita moschata]XP_022964135.1 anoctamin-like protein At1g73020 isoform X1 [Cucurbita moschata]